jgi:formylglycine-generating enzyme required for sulfatase activity
MKRRFPHSLQLLSLLALGLGAATPTSPAQTNTALDLRFYAGLSITGGIGSSYAIQCTPDLSHTNQWLTVTNLMLPCSPFLWVDTGTPSAPRRFYRTVTLTNIGTTNMVWIPPGTFTMGSPDTEVDRVADEGPQTVVTLSRGFWMSKYLVTQSEYLAVMGSNPSYFYGVRTTWPSGTYTNLDRPVETVSWSDAMTYCLQLTLREQSAGRIPTNYTYRLPTEAEWEYACRAGTTTRFSYGDDPGYALLGNYGWVGPSGPWTRPVGQLLPNPWGLFDMHGNVVEWCLDWYAPYPGGSVTDPQGGSSPPRRVMRGGSWNVIESGARSAARHSTEGNLGGYYSIGFRVVLSTRL